MPLTYIYDVLYQLTTTCKVAFCVGGGSVERKTNLPLIEACIKMFRKFIISLILVTFKTCKSCIMVFKNLVKIFSRNYIKKWQHQLQREVSIHYYTSGWLYVVLYCELSISWYSSVTCTGLNAICFAFFLCFARFKFDMDKHLSEREMMHLPQITPPPPRII